MMKRFEPLVTGLIKKGETQLGLLFVCCEGQEPMGMVGGTVLVVKKKWGRGSRIIAEQLHQFKILQEYLLLALSNLIAKYWYK